MADHCVSASCPSPLCSPSFLPEHLPPRAEVTGSSKSRNWKMKGERLSWKEQWVLSEVIWSAFDFSEPSEHFPAIIYLLYASTFNTADAPREIWGGLFMWKWCHVMLEMKAACKGNDSLGSICQTSKQYIKGRYWVSTLFTSPHTTKKLLKKVDKEHQKTHIFPQKALVVVVVLYHNWNVFISVLFYYSLFFQFEYSFIVSVAGDRWLKKAFSN